MAFEMAQQLHAQGHMVALLALFDTYFPGKLRYMPSPALFPCKAYNFVQKADRHLGSLLLLRPKDQLNYLFGMIGRIKTRIGRKIQALISRSDAHDESSLSRALREVLNANRQAVNNYVPQVYPGRIILFLSSEAPERVFYDRRLGWHEMAGEGLEVHLVPGSHETLFGDPHVRVLAEILRVCLQKVQGPPLTMKT